MAKSDVFPQEFDSRMVEWNLKHNRITKDQLKSYLSSLPDDAANCVTLEIEGGDPSANGSDTEHA